MRKSFTLIPFCLLCQFSYMIISQYGVSGKFKILQLVLDEYILRLWTRARQLSVLVTKIEKKILKFVSYVFSVPPGINDCWLISENRQVARKLCDIFRLNIWIRANPHMSRYITQPDYLWTKHPDQWICRHEKDVSYKTSFELIPFNGQTFPLS